MTINIAIKYINSGMRDYPPTYATPDAAAFDLRASLDEPRQISPGGQYICRTGIALYIADPELAGFIFARSGLAVRGSIDLVNAVGVIDADYQGEIMVALHNRNEHHWKEIRPYDRIAQMVIAPIVRVRFAEVEEFPESIRGEGGFGHTGR